jgi:hypothetical protein
MHAIRFLYPNGFMDFVIKKKLGAESVYKWLNHEIDHSKFGLTILGKNSGYWVLEIQKMGS